MNKNIVIGISVIVLAAAGYFLVTRENSPATQNNSQVEAPTLTAPTGASSESGQTQVESSATVSGPTETVAPKPVSTPKPTTPAPQAGTYTLAQVATHKDATSCYAVVRGSVYDLTTWIQKHPGGPQRILSMCGKDATSAFEGQHGGQPRPENELDGFKIGTLAK
jgi:cytochrome b involved in lipid metabolism